MGGQRDGTQGTDRARCNAGTTGRAALRVEFRLRHATKPGAENDRLIFTSLAADTALDTLLGQAGRHNGQGMPPSRSIGLPAKRSGLACLHAFAARRTGGLQEIGHGIAAFTALQHPGWAGAQALVATRATRQESLFPEAPWRPQRTIPGTLCSEKPAAR